MNKKQMFLFILWVSLVVGLIAFGIIYVIYAQIDQVAKNESLKTVFKIINLFN